MKRLALAVMALLILGSTWVFAGCSLPGIQVVRASGPATTQDYDMTGFTSVDAGSVFHMEIVPSSAFSVSVTSNENMFDYIEVTKSGSTLRLSLKNGISVTGPLTLDARISMPEIWGLTLSGAASATANGFSTTHDFRLNLSGASSAAIEMQTGKFTCDISGASRAEGSLNAGDSNMRLSGAANLGLDGSAGNTTMDVSGASNASLSDFMMQDASVTISGGSRASITVNGKLNVNLSGGSTLQYAGNPTMGNVDVTGGSTLQKR